MISRDSFSITSRAILSSENAKPPTIKTRLREPVKAMLWLPDLLSPVRPHLPVEPLFFLALLLSRALLALLELPDAAVAEGGMGTTLGYSSRLNVFATNSFRISLRIGAYRLDAYSLSSSSESVPLSLLHQL
jgi:hypothetical protein